MAKVSFRGLFEKARNAYKYTITKRQRFAMAVAAVICLGILVGLPFYLVGQPRFFERYASIAGYYSTWARSTHAEVSCENCHVRPRLIDKIAYRSKAVAEFFASGVIPKISPSTFGNLLTRHAKSAIMQVEPHRHRAI